MNRTGLLTSLTAILILLGLVNHARNFLILSIPLLVFLSAALLFYPMKIQLNITRTLSTDHVEENSPVKIMILVENTGPKLELVQFNQVLYSPLEKVDGKLSQLTMLRPGDKTEIQFSVRAKRGIYILPYTICTAREHFDLLQNHHVDKTSDHFLSLPTFSRFRHIPIRPEQTRGFPGPIPARKGGSGIDFFGVREYQIGDPLRWVNWRHTARHVEGLFSNEFEQEHIADVGLILDARLQNNIYNAKDDLFEHAVRMTASIAEAFLAEGNRVGLLIYGLGIERTFPGYGKIQQNRILRALARAKPGHNFSLETLNYLPVRLFPPHSQIVFISPLSALDIQPLIRLRAKGYEVMLISPDPIDFETKGIKPQSNLELATRLARVERNLWIQKLQRAGVKVLEWRVDEPITAWLRTTMNRRSLRYHHLRLSV